MKKVIAIFDAKDMTRNQYQAVMHDLEKTGNEAPGGRLAHMAGQSDQGMKVIDLWNSSKELEQFSSILVPILVKNGITPPQPKVYPLINEDLLLKNI